MTTDGIGVYVHIPYCVSKCRYCDFCSFPPSTAPERGAYVSALLREMESYQGREIAVNTVFIGGGTPSLLEPSELSLIMNRIRDIFRLSPECEITIEANPGTLTEEKLSAYKVLGINRLSMGLQSIHENELKKLGRIHTYSDLTESYEAARRCGFDNINLDLMYGLPSQTPESFSASLDAVASLAPEHISVYGLILEEGTPFWDARESLELPDEDTELRMYELAAECLAKHGYMHYEISNYALPGRESRHNLKYWENKSFIGVGVAAYSSYGGRRYGNFAGIDEYLSENPTQYVTEEATDAESSAYEYVMLGLRLSDGISLSEYERKYSTDFLLSRRERILELVKGGYMSLGNDRLALTEKGFYVSNSILTDLL